MPDTAIKRQKITRVLDVILNIPIGTQNLIKGCNLHGRVDGQDPLKILVKKVR